MHRAILNEKQLTYVIILGLILIRKLKKVYISFCFQCYIKCVMGMMQAVS